MGIENGNSVKSLPCFRQLKVAKWQSGKMSFAKMMYYPRKS